MVGRQADDVNPLIQLERFIDEHHSHVVIDGIGIVARMLDHDRNSARLLEGRKGRAAQHSGADFVAMGDETNGIVKRGIELINELVSYPMKQ